jgi:hypothetical protein
MKSSMKFLCSTITLALLLISSAWGGQFKAVYSEVNDPEFKEWEAEMKADRILEPLESDLNSNLAISQFML